LFTDEARPGMGVQGTDGGNSRLLEAVRSRASYERIRDWVVGTEESCRGVDVIALARAV